MSEKKHSILIVEDIHSIREAILDLLRTNYNVLGAEDYNSAVQILRNEKIDLVISDIKMPGKSGLDLIKTIQNDYPNVLYALMTAYNINDYIHFAKNHSVWNIIPKYSFLDIRLIEVMVYKLLTKDIFGVEKYFSTELKVQPKSDSQDSSESEFIEPAENSIIYRRIRSDRDRNILTGKIGKFLKNKGAPNSIHQVLEELTSNAMIRAPKDWDGNYKYQFEIPSKDLIVPLENIELSDDDSFTIGYGYTSNTFITVVQDYFGSLAKEEILHRLDRHTRFDNSTGLPMGLSDSHGRGLYICREISDQLIFNIQKGKKTEAISLIDRDGRSGFKSLSIYSIE